MPRRTSTVAGREFGGALRPIIERTGLSIRQLAARLGWDHPKLSDLVNGKGGTNEPELNYLLGVCGATLTERDHLLALFHESRERGLLQFHDPAVPEQVHTLMDHEKRATKITNWSPILIPGLLQIPAYTRAASLASPMVADKDVEQLVAAKSARRAILRDSCQFTFYVLERVLTMPVGGPDVMSEQLHDLLRMSVRPYISLRIVRVAVLDAFMVMKFEKLEPMVYVESLNSRLFLDDKESIKLYAQAVASLDRTALSAEESRQVITDIVT